MTAATTRSMTGYLAGVDVGGSKIAVLIADGDLRPVARHLIATGVGDAPAAIDQVADAVEAALRAGGLRREDLAAVGVGVPGRVDPVAGVVTLAVNLGWHDLPLGPQLERRFGVPVRVENDVKAAAAGLFARKLTQAATDLAFIGIGTGISAGVILDGRLYRGPRGLAGEIGHTVLDEDGPRCQCGLNGCLEAMASGRGIAAIAEAALADGAQSSLAAIEGPTSADVYAAAARGDALALDIVERAGRAVARAIHGLVMTYDLRRVILGGGVTAAGRTFGDPVHRGLDHLRAASPLAREALSADIVHVLPPDAEAGAWGAVVLARDAAAGPGVAVHDPASPTAADVAPTEVGSA